MCFTWAHTSKTVTARCFSDYNRRIGPNGDIVQNIHKLLIRSSTSGFAPDETSRVTQELVTPKNRAKSAPEQPSSLTAIQDIEQRASTTTRLRLPEQSSPKEILYFLQTCLAKVAISIGCPESRKFFFTRSSSPDITSWTNSLSPNIL